MALIMDSADDAIVPGAGGSGGRNADGGDSGCDGLGVAVNAKGLNARSMLVCAFSPVARC